jgi:fucose 4-O-acetylase-like acetyltransferase
MEPIIPYIFFIYVFIVTWWLLMNYETIKEFSSSMRECNGFISITVAIFVFVGVATLYNIDTRDEDYKEKINAMMF